MFDPNTVQVMAHKVVLASCSPYLHSILMRLRHSHQQPVIFLSCINISNLTKLVTFMYCGQVDIEESQLESFLQSAVELKVKGLVATEATTAAKGVEHAKSISEGPKVTKKISSATLKGVAKSDGSTLKAFSKERVISPASSQSSNLVQEQVTSAHDFASRDKMPSGDEEKVEIDEVVEVEAVEEVGSEKASPFAGAKSSFGADAGFVEIAEIVCQCGLVKVVRTVKKESGNKGKKFFTCPKQLKPCIGSFQWCDQVAPTIQGSESSGGTQAFELNQDIGSEGGKEIKEIETR